MNKKNHTLAPWTFLAVVAAAFGASALIAGCGTSTVSKGVTDEGNASEVVFPALLSASAKGGVFPNVDNLRQVGPGVTKDQLYDLLGPPHFAEGIGAVREWDYVFQFRALPAGSVTTCQYKVIFDKDVLARSFYWKPASCAWVLNPPVIEAPPAMVKAPSAAPSPLVKKMSIGADGLFRFGKYAPDDLLPEGRRRIAEVGAQVQRDFKSVSSVRVVGHADRLGTAASNDALSLARAQTVGHLLVQSGIPEAAMQMRGEGSRRPVVACGVDLKRAALVDCLQPNRRVEVEFAGDVQTDPPRPSQPHQK